MKPLKKIFPFVLFFFVSCSSIRVTTDYDTKVNFNKYKTFAFYKKGIDESTISDLDIRRILHAIESELLKKGMRKSLKPDVLVSIRTKSRKRVDFINNNFIGNFNPWFYGGMNPWFYGGMNPWFYGGMNPWFYGQNSMFVSSSIEGTLFIELIDANKKQLIWQGVGLGNLYTKDVLKKEERIKEFVKEIMEKYPPQKYK